MIDPNKPISESLKESGTGKIKVKKAEPQQESMGFYSRRDRRRLAKQFGLDKIKETREEKLDRQHRAMEAGQQIHSLHVMEAENSLRNQKAEKEALRIQGLVEIFGEEKVKEILADEAKITAKKNAKNNRKRK